MEQRRTYFTTRDLLMMAALAALGGVVSTYVNAIGDLFQSVFGFAGTTQWAAGLHVLWLTLAVGLTRKQGAGTITGLLKGGVELLTGNTHGLLVVLVDVVAGLLVDLGFLPFRRKDSLAAYCLAGGLASASNVFVFQLFASVPADTLAYWAMLLVAGVAFLSGVLFVGVLSWALLNALRRAYPIFLLAAALLTVALLLLSFPVAGVRLGRVRGTRLFVSTALLLGLLQVLFVRDGAVLVEIGPLVVTAGGVERGVYVAGRFLSVILLSYLFVLTTEPNDLAHALMHAGLPYRYGFALITALRLVPTFEQEGQIVYNAQLARGVRYDVRSPRRLLTLARQFVLPLLVSALGKVDALAVSMEGRCFGKYPTRTFLREVRVKWLDAVALGVLGAVITALGYWILRRFWLIPIFVTTK